MKSLFNVLMLVVLGVSTAQANEIFCNAVLFHNGTSYPYGPVTVKMGAQAYHRIPTEQHTILVDLLKEGEKTAVAIVLLQDEVNDEIAGSGEANMLLDDQGNILNGQAFRVSIGGFDVRCGATLEDAAWLSSK